MPDTRRVNEWLLDLINGHAGQSGAIDNLGIFIANNGLYVLAAVLAGFGIMELRRGPRRAFSIAAAACMALLIAGALILLLGTFVSEARPFVHDSDTVLLVKHANDKSFPSDHTTVAAAAAMVGALAWRRWAALFLGGALAIGVARVFVGVHYPGDIAGGMAFGMLAGIAAWTIVRHLPVRRAGRMRPAAASATHPQP